MQVDQTLHRLLGAFQLRVGQSDFRTGRFHLLDARRTFHAIDQSNRLLIARERLISFLWPKAGVQLVEGLPALFDQRAGFGQPLQQIVLFQDDQWHTLANRYSFFNKHLFYSSANTRAQPDLVRLDHTGDFLQRGPLLTPQQYASQGDGDHRDGDDAFGHGALR